MTLLNSVVSFSDHGYELIAALIGILSMIVARLLDWYFPSRHHRRLDKENEEDEEAEGVKK